MTRMIYPSFGAALGTVAVPSKVPGVINHNLGALDDRLLNRHHRRKVGSSLSPRWKDKLLKRVKYLRGVAKHGV